jgi:hypothetical protein
MIGPETVVPWDPVALEAWTQLAEALAAHRVRMLDGTTVRLADHPNLETVSSGILGLGGVREMTGALVARPDYNRSVFINAVSDSVHAFRSNFPDKYGFVALFEMHDDLREPSLGEEIVERLQSEYNNPGQLTLGYFQELLSDVGPTPTGVGRLLYETSKTTYTYFQALTSWIRPFTRDPSKVASGTPATGIELGYRDFGATYFELYGFDVDNPSLWSDLREWAEILREEAPTPDPDPDPEPGELSAQMLGKGFIRPGTTRGFEIVGTNFEAGIDVAILGPRGVVVDRVDEVDSSNLRILVTTTSRAERRARTLVVTNPDGSQVEIRDAIVVR